MDRRTGSVAALLFFSGFAALIYQTVWLREFRLIFGASTNATAAVLAVFMAGLGIGSAILGRRADSHSSPLAFYSRLEMLISAAALATLLLMWAARHVYIAAGGSPRLGIALATLLRLVLAAIILAAPTVLMGGTLPAAARAVERTSARRAVGVLYGINTLGAVAGVVVSTFFLLETYGNRRTLLLAALVNLAVAVTARSMARNWPEISDAASDTSATPSGSTKLPPTLVLSCAAVAGFAFLLMEIVWYRMLGPLLGGTTFTFGLILAVALAGISLGGLAYRVFRPTIGLLAVTASMEALAVVIPFAAGDRIAAFANVLRPIGNLGFWGFTFGWSIIVLIVIAPAALISGAQFPLLIALLGRGGKRVGADVGAAYAWNTAGAIAGSLAGGFGLLPLLGAPGAWRLTTVLLAVLGVTIAWRALIDGLRMSAAVAVVIAAVAAAATFAEGPTAFWRHSATGAGRASLLTSQNDVTAIRNQRRRSVVWERDGRESSVAETVTDDLAFIVNGKSDGAATGDAGTQIMIGMVGAFLHPNPRNAMVVGLGTGETAGWLAAVPSIQRVDVVELEPVVVQVARDCAAVNQRVLQNSKVHIAFDDAREVLLTTTRRYDLIASEPSNPYRAGIASLYTREYYQAIAARLQPQGIFLQWTQAYDIDAPTLKTIYATISSVFPNVQTYWTTPGDLLLVGTRERLRFDSVQLRKRLASEPFRTAALRAWQVTTLEGFFSHLLADEATAAKLAATSPGLNTDDLTIIEFSLARALNVHRPGGRSPSEELAASSDAIRGVNIVGPFDWEAVAADRAASPVVQPPPVSVESRRRREFATAWREGRLADAARLWASAPFRPSGVIDSIALCETLADAGDERALPLLKLMEHDLPIESRHILARLRFRQNQIRVSADLLRQAFILQRSNPWVNHAVGRRAIELALDLADNNPTEAPALYDALSVPFAVGQLNETRRSALAAIAFRSEGCGSRTIAALKSFEPFPLWLPDYLATRERCYREANLTGLAARAAQDLQQFESREAEGLMPAR